MTLCSGWLTTFVFFHAYCFVSLFKNPDKTLIVPLSSHMFCPLAGLRDGNILAAKSKMNQLGKVYTHFFIWVCSIFLYVVCFLKHFIYFFRGYLVGTGKCKKRWRQMPSFAIFWRIFTTEKERRNILLFFSCTKYCAVRTALASSRHGILPFWWKAVVLNVYAASQHDRLKEKYTPCDNRNTTGTSSCVSVLLIHQGCCDLSLREPKKMTVFIFNGSCLFGFLEFFFFHLELCLILYFSLSCVSTNTEKLEYFLFYLLVNAGLKASRGEARFR